MASPENEQAISTVYAQQMQNMRFRIEAQKQHISELNDACVMLRGGILERDQIIASLREQLGSHTHEGNTSPDIDDDDD